MLADASVASYWLKSRDAARIDVLGVAVGFGVGGAIATWVAPRGGGANPALTLALALSGRLSWRRVPSLVASQLAGAFAAAGAVHAAYADALNAFDAGVRISSGHQDATAGLFTSFPASFLSTTGDVADQVIATGLLVFALLTLSSPPASAAAAAGDGDEDEDEEEGGEASVALGTRVGLVLSAVTLAFHLNSGCSATPARDLGPRLYCALVAGYGSHAFGSGVHWWASGVAAPLVGGVLAALVHRVARLARSHPVRLHLQQPPPPQPPKLHQQPQSQQMRGPTFVEMRSSSPVTARSLRMRSLSPS